MPTPAVAGQAARVGSRGQACVGWLLGDLPLRWDGQRVLVIGHCPSAQCTARVGMASTAMATRLVPTAWRIPQAEDQQVGRDEQESAAVGQQVTRTW
jgi:hypothetical protein